MDQDRSILADTYRTLIGSQGVRRTLEDFLKAIGSQRGAEFSNVAAALTSHSVSVADVRLAIGRETLNIVMGYGDSCEGALANLLNNLLNPESVVPPDRKEERVSAGLVVIAKQGPRTFVQVLRR